jgi:hypothetical protein
MQKTKILLFSLLTFSILTPNQTNIFTRFYYLKSLSKANNLLAYLDKHHYDYHPCVCFQQDNCVCIDSTLFFHPTIISCIQEMMKTTSLKPALQLSQNISNYTTLHDELYIRELCLLIFTIHKQILLDTCKENPQALKTVTLNTILEISEKINQLPIAEVLNAIDMLVTELPPLLEKYEFNSKIPWKEWLKKYWWVPPIFGGWIMLKILLSLQRPHYYFSPYLNSRPTIPLPSISTNDPVLAEIVMVDKKQRCSYPSTSSGRTDRTI